MSTERVTNHVVTFTRPFVIEGYRQALPAGDYVVETLEERLLGVSFPAYRRVATSLHVDAIPGRPGEKQIWVVEPAALDEALARDAR
jgi:hypothetical protein